MTVYRTTPVAVEMWGTLADNEGSTNNLRFALSIKIALKGVFKPSVICTSLASYITKQPQWGDGGSVCVFMRARAVWCTSLNWCRPSSRKTNLFQFKTVSRFSPSHTSTHSSLQTLQNTPLTCTYTLHMHHTIALAHKKHCLVNSGLNLTGCQGRRASKARAAEWDGPFWNLLTWY